MTTPKPYIVDGRPYIHLKRVHEILGDDSPEKQAGQAGRLFKKLTENPPCRLEPIRIGSRWLFPEDQILELKKALHDRRFRAASPRP